MEEAEAGAPHDWRLLEARPLPPHDLGSDLLEAGRETHGSLPKDTTGKLCLIGWSPTVGGGIKTIYLVIVCAASTL